jgi:O-antigen ligase
LEELSNIRIREQLLRDRFTPAESILFAVSLFALLLAFHIGDPRSYWLLGSLLILGCLTPFILKTHEQAHPFFIDLLWPKFWLVSAPALVLSIQFAIGLFHDPYNSVKIGASSYHTLDSIHRWIPTSISGKETWLIIASFGAAYILSSLLYLIPKSCNFFERLLPWPCMGAVILATFGFIQKGLGMAKPPLSAGTGSEDFFAFFPYDGHWAAFAMIWCCVCTSMSLLHARYEDNPQFINSTAPWYLAGGLLLGASAVLVQAQLPAVMLLFTLCIMLLITAFEYLNNQKETHRTAIAGCCAIASSVAFGCCILRIFQHDEFSEQRLDLQRAAWDMFKEKPFFGWGIDSYERLLPFYGSDVLNGERYERATSDVLQLLAEFGAFGGIVIAGFFITFIIRYIHKNKSTRLSNHLLIGCVLVVVLAFFDTPFMSPAVLVSFFTIFFSALRWGLLSRSNPDEVDSKHPQLVIPRSERIVPFFNIPYEEKEK